MFTGMVEETGTVRALERSADGARLRVAGRIILPGLQLGDSIAVNGCCLTAVEIGPEEVGFDLLEETLRRTNLGDLTPGTPVNLERALRADRRLGGHFVQGHVDLTTEILRFEQQGADYRLEVQLPRESAGYVMFKGSICLDGISLTVAEVSAETLTMWIIPHTLAATNLHHRRVGERMNVEFDLLAKYVERLLAVRR